MPPKASNNGSTRFLGCPLLLFRWNAPGSFIKLFSSQQKFTLPHTAAWQPFLNTHISRACVPSQRFAVSRVSNAASRPSALSGSSCLRGGRKAIRVPPIEMVQKAMIYYKVPFLNCLLCQNHLCCHSIQPLKC